MLLRVTLISHEQFKNAHTSRTEFKVIAELFILLMKVIYRTCIYSLMACNEMESINKIVILERFQMLNKIRFQNLKCHVS